MGPYIHVDFILLRTTHPNITAATQKQPGRVIYPTVSQMPFEEQDKAAQMVIAGLGTPQIPIQSNISGM